MSSLKKKRIILQIEATFTCGRPYQLVKRGRAAIAALPGEETTHCGRVERDSRAVVRGMIDSRRQPE